MYITSDGSSSMSCSRTTVLEGINSKSDHESSVFFVVLEEGEGDNDGVVVVLLLLVFVAVVRGDRGTRRMDLGLLS